MMSRPLSIIVCLGILAWPNDITDPPAPPREPFPVTRSLELNDSEKKIAREVERRMREHGFSDALIAGALVNAYAESGLHVGAVGREGERGIFQLHPRGLGSRMTHEQMHDVGSSVDRIAWALRRSKKIMELERRGATPTEHAAAFCTEIERPSDKQLRARQRTRLLKKMLIN